MAKLNFTKKEGLWESNDFPVSGDYNIHVEKIERGQLQLMQKTAGSNFAPVAISSSIENHLVVDADVQVLVPKVCKIVSTSEIKEAYYTEGA